MTHLVAYLQTDDSVELLYMKFDELIEKVSLGYYGTTQKSVERFINWKCRYIAISVINFN